VIKNYTSKFWLLGFCLSFNLSAACNFNSAEFIERLNSPKEILSIDVHIPESRQWTKNLLKITLDRSQNINPSFRDKFDSKITVRYSFGRCEYNSRVRISGDWKDHVQFDNGQFKVSLDVRLKEGNILNAVRFKLLIPETRNSEHEVLGALVLRSLGFIAPETFMVNASVNNAQSSYLFQENSEKEMLERNLKREGPIFEGNEDLLWSFRDYKTMELEHLALGKVVNDAWSVKGDTSSIITILSFADIQKIYLEFAGHKLKESNSSLGLIFKQYAIFLLAMNGQHALFPHNRKFYFNALDQEFEPIYYDGNLRLDRNLSITSVNRDVDIHSFFYPLNADIINTMDLQLTQVLSSEALLQSFLDRSDGGPAALTFFKRAVKIISNNFYALVAANQNFNLELDVVDENFSERNFRKYLNQVKEKELTDFTIFTELNEIDNRFYLSMHDNRGDSYEVALNEVIEIISNNKYNKKRAEFIPQNLALEAEPYNQMPLLEGSLFYSKGMRVEVDREKRVILLTQSRPNDWALMKYAKVSDWSINFKGKPYAPNDLPQQQRFNTLGLTGCLNFYKTIFSSSSIHINNGGCEDSLNIVNSQGNFVFVKVENAFADGLDADFSDITIQSLVIQASQNDCFDVSGGNYHIAEAELSFCGDKGLSIGEYSRFSSDRVSVDTANIGISTKDFSHSIIQFISMKQTKVCAEAMQKKQEFGGGHIKILELESCDGTFSVDQNSVIISPNMQ
jgi:hypothetical protein